MIQCQWCQAQNQPGTTSCQTCGAPLDERDKVSDSGWREAPRLRDMTEFQFSGSTCQVEGELVPVAEINLHPQDGVYFEHHVLLWKDESVPLSSLNTGGGMKRSIGGMPHIVTVANGPGRIAFSRDAPGELVVLPLHPGMELDVREHAFLVASHSVQYSFVRIKGLANLLHGGNGMYMDRFVTAGDPGMLLLHGNGNVLERMLRPGEKILVEPGGFLYKDSSVQMQAAQMPLKTGHAAARHVPRRDDRARPGRHPVDVRPPPRGLRAAGMNTYICRYCRQPSDPSAPTCPLCGAPVDIRSSVSDSGWVEQPPIKDMARLQFGQSHCQIAGTTVPVAEFNLAPNDWIYFSHHVLLWTEPQTRLTNMPMRGAWNRMMAGLPLVMVEAPRPRAHRAVGQPRGRGRGAADAARPADLGPRAPVPVRHRQHQATTGTRRTSGTRPARTATTGRPTTRWASSATCSARRGPRACCCCTRRATPSSATCSRARRLLIQPSSLLYRDVSVRMDLHLEYPRNMGFAFWHNRWSYRSIWLRLSGPGRVAVQSVYQPPEDTEVIASHSYATTHHW